MTDRPTPPPEPSGTGPLWVEGEIRLHLSPPGGGEGRVARIPRPFALIGRGQGTDLRIDDPAVSSRHAYLHLDRRGLFGVDLATRSGTLFPGGRSASGWLRPGQVLDVAGHRVEVLDAAARGEGDPGRGDAPGPPPDDPLGESGDASLAHLTLFPKQPPWEPRSVHSELLFLGRSPYSGFRVEGEGIARVHCVLVRARSGAYVVDLSRGRLRVNGRPVPDASPLAEGDVLTLGSLHFEVRRRSAAGPPARARPAPPVEQALATAIPSGWPWPPPESLVPAGQGGLAPEAQGALLAWIVQVVQAGQGEALRRQGEFQKALTDTIRQICLDNSAILHEHLERMERINEEIASLRDEIRQRLGPSRPRAPEAPAPPPLRLAPIESQAAPEGEQSTSWLLERIQRLEEENRTTWRDLLGRLGGQSRRVP